MPVFNGNRTIFSSSARGSGANNSSDFTVNAGGARFFLDWTAQSGSSPTLDVKIQVKDTLSGSYIDLPNASFAQKTSASGTDELTIYPGITAASNRAVSSVLSGTWRVVATVGGSSTPTYTFSMSVDLFQ